jgi:DNA-cytosine methyltransferase
MNVLSLFDGMSCGQIALNRAGVKYDNYFASEIDKPAIKVTMANYPNTIQIGDVTQVKGADLPKIDLLIGGSPCQGFSFAGKQLNFNDPRSSLFFEYVRLLRECSPKYFLLENVKMKKEYQDVISEQLGVEPILINSALVSAQNRNRLYWTNIPVDKPEDLNILLNNILEDNVDEKYYLSDKQKSMMKCFGAKYSFGGKIDNIKSSPILASYGKVSGNSGKILINNRVRCYTPIECERLQTVPDNYTDCVSDTQRYKMLGNGWTVDVIAHILRGLK